MKQIRKHFNIPIFIPHLGCPNACVFCDQRSISGKTEFHRERVEREIEEALSTLPVGSEAEIAYFTESIRNDTANDRNPPESAARSVHLIEALCESAARGGEKLAYATNEF